MTEWVQLVIVFSFLFITHLVICGRTCLAFFHALCEHKPFADRETIRIRSFHSQPAVPVAVMYRPLESLCPCSVHSKLLFFAVLGIAFVVSVWCCCYDDCPDKPFHTCPIVLYYLTQDHRTHSTPLLLLLPLALYGHWLVPKILRNWSGIPNDYLSYVPFAKLSDGVC